MSFSDEPGSPPPDPLEPAHYVAFLEHWAAEFPAAAKSQAHGDLSEPDGGRRDRPPAASLAGADRSSGAQAWGAAPARVTPEPGPLELPRRRQATERLRVRLAPEHLYWLRLTAARAGAKVDESLLVAAGLMLLAERGIDWRAVRSRSDLRAAVAAPSPPPPPPAWTGGSPSEP